jgi:hypothetical protein
VPDESEVLLFHPGSDVILEYWFERRKRMKTRKGQTSASDIPEKGVKARGVRLCGTRTISSIKAVAATIDTEDDPEPAPEPEATVSDPAPAALSLEEVEARAEELNRKLRNIVEKYETPDLFQDQQDREQ